MLLKKYYLNMIEDNDLDLLDSKSSEKLEDKQKKSRNLEVKTNLVLANYIKELSEDVKLTEYNLREKSLTCSSIWAKWLSYLYLEKENLQRIADAKKKVLSKKMSSSKVTDSVLRMKSEDKIAEGDDTMKKLAALSKQTQDSIDFIERALGILANFGFSIKNVTEVFKLQFSH